MNASIDHTGFLNAGEGTARDNPAEKKKTDFFSQI